MRDLRRLAAFLCGMAIGLGFLLTATAFLPGIWLPIALGALLSGLFVSEPWLAGDFGFFGPLSVALTSSVVAGWIISGGPFPYRIALIAIFGLTAVAAVAELALAFRRGGASLIKARGWLLVVVAAAITVSHASSAYAGAGHMVDWVVAHLGLSRDTASEVVHYVRKSIHFTFYGFVGLSGALASRNGRAPQPLGMTSLRFGFLCTLIIASFDETRQTSQPGRTGSVYDVMLDCAGAATFLFILYLIASRSKRRP